MLTASATASVAAAAAVMAAAVATKIGYTSKKAVTTSARLCMHAHIHTSMHSHNGMNQNYEFAKRRSNAKQTLFKQNNHNWSLSSTTIGCADAMHFAAFSLFIGVAVCYTLVYVLCLDIYVFMYNHVYMYEKNECKIFRQPNMRSCCADTGAWSCIALFCFYFCYFWWQFSDCRF